LPMRIFFSVFNAKYSPTTFYIVFFFYL